MQTMAAATAADNERTKEASENEENLDDGRAFTWLVVLLCGSVMNEESTRRWFMIFRSCVCTSHCFSFLEIFVNRTYHTF